VNRFFLFVILSWILGNPLLALLVLLGLSLPGYLYAGGWVLRLWNRYYRWRSIERLRQTVAINPHNVAALSSLGRELAMAGRPQEALEYLRSAEPRSANSAETLYFLGYSLLQTGDGEKGRDFVERALKIDPKFRYGEPHLALGDYHFQRQQLKAALPYYETLKTLHSSHVEGLYKLGCCHYSLGDYAKAERELTASVESFQTSPRYKRRLERSWYRKAKRLLKELGRQKSPLTPL